MFFELSELNNICHEIVNQEGKIIKENNNLYFKVNDKKIFKIHCLTKIDKNNDIRQSKLLLRVNNNLLIKTNLKSNLDYDSYLSIIRIGKLIKNNCNVEINNI